jgi:hypothetical protein
MSRNEAVPATNIPSKRNGLGPLRGAWDGMSVLGVRGDVRFSERVGDKQMITSFRFRLITIWSTIDAPDLKCS